MVIEGSKKTKLTGPRVAPRSSPYFQENKVWQVLNNVKVRGSAKSTKAKKQKSINGMYPYEPEIVLEYDGDERELYQEEKELLARELFIKQKMKKTDVLKLLFSNPTDLDLNYKEIAGDETGYALFKAFQDIVKAATDNESLNFSTYDNTIKVLNEEFQKLGINTDILHFNSNNGPDQEPYYKLWHLLYSYEGDKSPSGNENLYKILEKEAESIANESSAAAKTSVGKRPAGKGKPRGSKKVRAKRKKQGKSKEAVRR